MTGRIRPRNRPDFLSLTLRKVYDKLYNCISIVPQSARERGLTYFTQELREMQALIYRGRNDGGVDRIRGDFITWYTRSPWGSSARE